MNEELTLERVMEIGEQSKRILLENLPSEELYEYIDSNYRQEIKRQGIEQGIEQGRVAMQATLEQLLLTRFDHISAEISTALTRCTIGQLQALVNDALDVPDLDAFLLRIPIPNDDKRDQETTSTEDDG